MKTHEKFMTLALQQARKALQEGDFPVGCIIECNGEVVASGHRKKSYGKVNEIDHAEIIALRNFLAAEGVCGTDKVTIYSTMEPCLMCFSTLLVNGVRKFIYGYEDVMGGGTNLPLHLLHPLYSEIQPTIIGSVLRHESLSLFKSFFSSPDSRYLKNTLLAEYTLRQS